jgi:hypothetical protein
MGPHLPAVTAVSFFLVSALVTPSSQARTINDIPSVPHRVLQRSISPKFYKSLRKSPLEGLVVRNFRNDSKIAVREIYSLAGFKVRAR